MANDLVEHVARAMTRGEHSVWPWKDYVPAAERAIEIVLRAVDDEEASLNYDEDHRVGRVIARRCGIELEGQK